LAPIQPSLALAAAAAFAVISYAASRPATASTLLLGAYLIPLLAFGRLYAYTGFDPVYLPEVLLMVALVVSFPLWWSAYLDAVPRWYRLASAGFALLGLVATYNGLGHGYQGAMKGLIFVVYPLASAPCAAWIRVHGAQWRGILLAAAVASPLGLLVLTLANSSEGIAAAYGFYLAGLVALAVVWPQGLGRRVLIVAAYLGPVLLVGSSRRGPILTIVVALVVSQIARRQMPWRTVRPFVVGCAAGLAVLAFVMGISGSTPDHLPLVGTTVQRSTHSFGSPGPESEANVAFRFDLWRYSMETTLHHGFWLGTGFGRPFDFRFRNVDYRTVDTGGPHNSFVGVFYFMGVPAGLAFIAIVVAAFRSAGRRRDSPQLAAFQLAWLAAAVATMFTNVALEAPYIGGPIWILIAWSLLSRETADPESAGQRRDALHA
ncbi:MAG: O-antigen ligase family protein, partial [Candidatus Dormibacteraeota bacterium]|nr:O-antigen ligase family protein [Candidatus Dormibacteraeota bacterium]